MMHRLFAQKKCNVSTKFDLTMRNTALKSETSEQLDSRLGQSDRPRAEAASLYLHNSYSMIGFVEDINVSLWPTPPWAPEVHQKLWSQSKPAVELEYGNGVPCLALNFDKPLPIFIRSEYYKIWEHIQNQISLEFGYMSALIVWRHPGIDAS